MMVYELAIRVEEIKGEGDYRYLATSPDLPGLIVAGKTAEEVLALAPSVASALIASMKAEGDPLPETLRAVSSLPFESRVAVIA
jgi:predicted RNase H-like HicB family nuclease